MIQFRRIAAVLIGIWLGAAVLADVAVIQNFRTVDRFLASPGSPVTAVELNQIGRPQVKAILRRNAAEENNFIFTNWEWAQLGMGALLFLILLFGDRPQKLYMALVLGMLAIVAAERFFLTPQIVDLGRTVEGLPATDPVYKHFWMLHGIYSSVDIVKMAFGALLAFRLCVRRAPDKDHFVKEYEKMNAVTAKPAAAPGKSSRG